MVGELLVPGWLFISLVLHAARKERLGSAVGAAGFALGTYAMVRGGMLFIARSEFAGLVVMASIVTAIIGHAGLFGWAASPSGSRFLWYPLGCATGYWPPCISAQGSSLDQSMWKSFSVRLMLLVVFVDIAVVTYISRFFLLAR